MQVQRAEFPALLNGHQAARRFFAACFRPNVADVERLWVAHVDHQARCLALQCYEGGGESVDLPVRTIIADATRLGAAGLVLAHNHPGGDAGPSAADCRATRRLVRAAEPFDLLVLDHLIFAGKHCSSMRRMGLL